jgi:light-regulated signal transduction histidine kinase (bacteriophytochrome)
VDHALQARLIHYFKVVWLAEGLTRRSPVHSRTLQLKAANKELEAFSYSVSHDLRAPLITINGFCRLLQNKSKNGFDDKSNHYLTRIISACGQMGVRQSATTRNTL